MVVAGKKSFKIDIAPEDADAIREIFDRKKIGYADGATALFKWFAKLDDVLQSMILGQVKEADDLVETVFRRKSKMRISKDGATTPIKEAAMPFKKS